MNPSGTRQVHPLPMQSHMAPLQPLHPLQLLDSMEDSTESPWTPQRPARRRKTAWERRAQAMRTEGRAIGRLLKAVSSLSMHRGCQPTRLAAAFAYALEQPRQPAQDSTLQPSMEPSMAMSVDPAVPVDPAMHVEQLSGHGLQTQTVAAATGTEGPDLQIQTATDLQSGSSEDSASTADSGPRRPGDLWDPSEAYWSALLDASAEDWSRPAWATEGVDLQSAARLQSAESVFSSAEQLELRPSWEALETELPAYLQPVQPVDCENLYSSVETTRPKPGDCVDSHAVPDWVTDAVSYHRWAAALPPQPLVVDQWESIEDSEEPAHPGAPGEVHCATAAYGDYGDSEHWRHWQLRGLAIRRLAGDCMAALEAA